ncbi:protein fuzzy homolog isoform X2 [Poecile atricapillus]|uniref:protein fuzzy homolog isoform X2 n=1 Tax=Poecile atricapillus TaxID=48891 RepID=UPI00273A1A73|nr:protein fuzzy homolog isoform X2 [Poecile atricapillus]
MPEEEEGAPCLLCLATASGLPLFCRPPRPQLPFSLVGALHGVHLFGAMEGAELRQAATPTAHVTWGTYGNSISLILLSPSPAPARILDSAFGAMVLVLGLDELVPVRNVERLKRDLRDRLQRFGGAAHTDLCCLCFGSGGFGGSVLGTPRWGALSGADSAPLRALMMTSSWGGGANGRGPAARDLPVFLPNSSPQVPHRLLLLRLLPGLLLALLCGPRPSLQLLLAQLLPQFWGPLLEQLRGCARPRPPPMPPEVLGYLLIHRGQTHSGISKGAGQGGSLPPHLRAAALRNLQKLLAPQYRPELGGRGSPPGLRLCYVSLPTHTGCCLLRPELLLLLLLPPGTPRDPLNPTAMRVLSALSCG